MKRKNLVLLTSLLLAQTTAVLGMIPNEERGNTARSAAQKFVVDKLVQETKDEATDTASHLGEMSGHFDSGIMYLNGHGVDQSYEKALTHFHKASSGGFAPAHFLLGNMYEQGQGVIQNLKEAARYYRMAAEQDHLFAQFNLANMYLQGAGVTQSYREAAT